jgi:hypothetical protein
MQLVYTLEGYPTLLKTRTRSTFFSERSLAHGNRTTPWVYLTQNPRGRWQVLTPDPSEPGNVLCVAGADNVHLAMREFIQEAFSLGILKRGTGMNGNPRSTRHALGSLGFFERYPSPDLHRGR